MNATYEPKTFPQTSKLLRKILPALLVGMAWIPAFPVTVTRSVTLTVTPGSQIFAGTPIFLTATVANGRMPVTQGMVNFCDAAASVCAGTGLIGTAQLNSSGNATTAVVLGTGVHNINAVFTANNQLPVSSPSDTQGISVSASAVYGSSVTLTGSGSNYTASITSAGRGGASGTVSLFDLANPLASLGSATLNPASASLSFQGGATLTAGGNLAGGTVADLRGIGRKDLIFANKHDGTISVFLSNGNGTFQSQNTIPVGAMPNSVAIGDFNNDGKLDLVVGNQSCGDICTGTVSVLLGNGNGTFQARRDISIGVNPGSVVVNDFDSDGNADIAVLDNYNRTITILDGSGDGNFQVEGNAVPTGLNPLQIVTADFNNDGVADLAVSNANEGDVTVWIGNGDGTFQTGTNVAAGSYPDGITVDDFNKDGSLDMAVANANDGTVSILLGNGDGTFQPQSALQSGSWDANIASADLDGDGNTDLVVTNSQSNTIGIYFGNGDGTFRAQATQPAIGAAAVLAADLDGDGIPDLCFANPTGKTLSVLMGRETVTANINASTGLLHGTHMLVASYAGDALHVASQSSPLSVIFAALNTTLSLKASVNPSALGQPITVLATVSPVPVSGTGTVSFYAGATLVATSAVDASGNASFVAGSLPVGSTTVVAQFNGNDTYAPSTSNVWNQTVRNSSFMIAAQKTTYSMNAGSSITVPLQLTSVDGPFAGNISLSEMGLPVGYTVRFSQNPVASLNGTQVVNMTITSNSGAMINRAKAAILNGKSGKGSITLPGNPIENFAVTVNGVSGSVQSSTRMTLIVSNL